MNSSTKRRHTIIHFPHAETLRYARLDTLWEERTNAGSDLILDYHELVLETAPQLVSPNGKPAEYLQGQYIPRRLRFAGISALQRTGLFSDPDNFPVDHRSEE